MCLKNSISMFKGYLHWIFFFMLEMFFHHLLKIKPEIILFPLVSLIASNFFSLSLVFSNLIMMWFGMFFFVIIWLQILHTFFSDFNSWDLNILCYFFQSFSFHVLHFGLDGFCFDGFFCSF